MNTGIDNVVTRHQWTVKVRMELFLWSNREILKSMDTFSLPAFETLLL
jgi:hypothetical protein